MNLQIDMAWNEYADGCGPTVWKGCTQACPPKQAWTAKTRCSCRERTPCYLDRSPLSQPFCSGRALRLSSNARGHQWTFPAQFMTQRMLNLGRWRWAGQAEVCFGAWLLPHCLSELGNSTTLSASLGQDMWPREPEVWPGWFLYLYWGCPPVLVQIENRRRIVLSY